MVSSTVTAVFVLGLVLELASKYSTSKRTNDAVTAHLVSTEIASGASTKST
jgi:hypothetical protein